MSHFVTLTDENGKPQYLRAALVEAVRVHHDGKGKPTGLTMVETRSGGYKAKEEPAAVVAAVDAVIQEK